MNLAALITWNSPAITAVFTFIASHLWVLIPFAILSMSIVYGINQLIDTEKSSIKELAKKIKAAPDHAVALAQQYKYLIKDSYDLARIIQAAPEHAAALAKQHEHLIRGSTDLSIIIEAAPEHAVALAKQHEHIIVGPHTLSHIIEAAPEHAAALAKQHEHIIRGSTDLSIIIEAAPEHKEALEALFPQFSEKREDVERAEVFPVASNQFKLEPVQLSLQDPHKQDLEEVEMSPAKNVPAQS